jgi:hypothetical protein
MTRITPGAEIGINLPAVVVAGPELAVVAERRSKAMERVRRAADAAGALPPFGQSALKRGGSLELLPLGRRGRGMMVRTGLVRRPASQRI